MKHFSEKMQICWSTKGIKSLTIKQNKKKDALLNYLVINLYVWLIFLFICKHTRGMEVQLYTFLNLEPDGEWFASHSRLSSHQ
jgi:hypothetical protein